MQAYYSSRLLIIILDVIFLFTWKNPSLKIIEVILRYMRHFLRCGQVFQGTIFNCIFFSFELPSPSSPPNFLFMQLLLLYISFWEIYGWAQYNGRNFCFENIFWTLCYYDTRQADGQHNGNNLPIFLPNWSVDYWWAYLLPTHRRVMIKCILFK